MLASALVPALLASAIAALVVAARFRLRLLHRTGRGWRTFLMREPIAQLRLGIEIPASTMRLLIAVTAAAVYPVDVALGGAVAQPFLPGGSYPLVLLLVSTLILVAGNSRRIDNFWCALLPLVLLINAGVASAPGRLLAALVTLAASLLVVWTEARRLTEPPDDGWPHPQARADGPSETRHPVRWPHRP